MHQIKMEISKNGLPKKPENILNVLKINIPINNPGNFIFCIA